MRIFRLTVDERVKHRVEPASLTKLQLDALWGAGAQAEDETPLFLAVHMDQRTVYPDFLEFPLPLVSDRMRALLAQYMPGLAWKSAILSDIRQARQDAYWVLRPPVVECLSPQTLWYPNGTLKHLVLRHGDIQAPVFRISGLMEPYIYIQLAVAESLLRRSFTGIGVQRVEMEVKER
ncbi:hypothetical protein [Paenibacillus sp. IHBB 3054]|uniref:hypothetical protein n=1 Tax=Paenibacillus sp. IHBB 3054 TaxID=3425689 RepID=UPI003F66204E